MKKKLFSMFLVFALFLVPMLLAVPSFAAEPAEPQDPAAQEESAAAPLYQSAYDLFRQYVYGSDTVLTEHMELTLTILSTIAALFVVCLPFVVVFFVIKFVTGVLGW